jgi:NADPH:quinone reductase-like Zn-dependent oxidoreductase
VRVAVRAASINGIDAYVAAGYVWDAMPHEFPVVLGRDFAGIVDAIGDGVTSFTVGDRVMAAITGMTLYVGAIAALVTVEANLLVPIPDAVSDEQATASGLAGVTALDLVDALALSADDVVLVSGATGGVGVFAVQLAAATGATVLATARPGDADFVRSLGAAEAVDFADLSIAVGPDRVTAIIHAAGDPVALAQLLRPGGRLASALGATAEAVGRDDITVTPVLAVATADKLQRLLGQVAAGALAVHISRTFALDEAADAIGAFGEPKLGKLVVTFA